MNAAASTLVERLIHELRLRKCLTPEELIALAAPQGTDGGAQVPQSAGFIERPGLMVQEHHKLDPTVLVYDPFLGTLGLVEVVDDTAAAALRIGECVEQAAYLRQLCLLEAERTSASLTAECRALTIELVIVFPRTAPATAMSAASAALTDFARATGYLRSIGVSLLHEQPNGTFDEKELHRAFAWLLLDVRDWFAEKAAPRPRLEKAWSLRLTNYRHHGVRTYEFDGKARFHVLHGYNGSGKSTFSEAFELLLTGSIERLEEAKQQKYFPVVRFRRSQLRQAMAPAPVEEESEAIVSVFEGGRELARTTLFKTDDADANALDRRADVRPADLLPAAASFRLDQRLMDTLVRSHDAKRAEIFLRAFFPTDAPNFDRLTAAQTRTEAALAEVPKTIVERIPTSAKNRATEARRQLEWTSQPPQNWTAGVLHTLEPCLPVSAAQLKLLSASSEAIAATVKRFETEPGSITDVAAELESLDNALTSNKTVPEAVRDLPIAIKVLDALEAWQPKPPTDEEGSFQAALDAWLEAQALADLASKYFDVAAVLSAARLGGWHADAKDAAVFERVAPSAEEIAALGSARDRLASARNAARREVVRLCNRQPSSAATGGQAQDVPTKTFLLKEEKDALNRVARWLPSLARESATELGELIAAALRSNDRSSLPPTFATPISEANNLLAACQAILDKTPASAKAFRACRTAFDAFGELSKLATEVENSFFMQMTRQEKGGPLLNAALNELLALFKPAPWAYADIALKAERRGGDRTSEGLQITTADAARADLRLNTAEMNSFALALCLLCAPTLKNPLGLVLLDDPLQNMDEMTVAAVARGLGKLIRVYPAGWRIVALFHSEEDLLRIQEEVPTAVYRLPWLTTTPLAGERPIQADRDSDSVPRPQTLEELLQLPDVARSASTAEAV